MLIRSLKLEKLLENEDTGVVFQYLHFYLNKKIHIFSVSYYLQKSSILEDEKNKMIGDYNKSSFFKNKNIFFCYITGQHSDDMLRSYLMGRAFEWNDTEENLIKCFDNFEKYKLLK